MKTKHYLLFLFVLIYCNSFGQHTPQKLYNNLNLYDPAVVKKYNDMVISKKMSNTDIEQITGTPYLSKNFEKGNIITKDSTLYSGIYLRYNAYEDIMEFKKDSFALEISNKFPIKQLSIKGIVYEKKVFKYDNSQKIGYFERLEKGSINLYARKTIAYIKAKPSRGYQDARPAEFKKNKTEFFLTKGETPNVSFIANKSTLINLLGEEKKQISNYIKSNRLNIKKECDLRKIITYYNYLKK
ncbi:hypothetical protein [Ancylomarina longa]|uniref:Uncharacterized protein n=1 Tax=Ancylomarina longa TaxID=2487017 RepID=A0A434ATV1_9BACT|nr:hypothetical protein [Ancylomarina longa]RUT77848.1 hypothetical protein DLK05_10945 [Ancylomarina longa]